MREDFHKVIIEKPRWGSRMRNLKTRWSTRRYDPDGDFADPDMFDLNRKVVRKSFSDRLSPLRRYLATQVGRPWSKIEGEFRKALDTRTVIGRHLWDHARDMVEQKVRMNPDGRPVTLRGYPVWTDFFVHPRTGILHQPKPERIDPHRERQKKIANTESVVLDESTKAEKAGDLWYLFIDEGRVEEVVEVRRDRTGKQVFHRTTRPVVRKKQANTDEIRRIRAAIEEAVE